MVKANNQEAAFAKFQEALNLNPSLRPSLVGLATAALKLGKNAEAATAAETILKLDPRNEQALRLRYNACLALNDPDRLFDALTGLAAVEPTVAKNGMLKLAFDAYDGNDKAKVKARFMKVLEVDPNQPQAHYYLALVLVGDGNTAEAKAHLEKFVALAPERRRGGERARDAEAAQVAAMIRCPLGRRAGRVGEKNGDGPKRAVPVPNSPHPLSTRR